MSRTSFALCWTILCLLLLVVGGCGTSAPAKFYLLQPRPEFIAEPPAAVSPTRLAIGVGPIEIAEYLDRPQMVTRIGPNELFIDEFERWAEPLRDGISRIVATNLASLLQADGIAVHAWRSPIQIDYRVALTLTAFESTPAGETTLAGWWTLYDANNQIEVIRRTVSMKEQAATTNTAALVQLQSRLLQRLCEQITAAIRQTAPTGEEQPSS